MKSFLTAFAPRTSFATIGEKEKGKVSGGTEGREGEREGERERERETSSEDTYSTRKQRLKCEASFNSFFKLDQAIYYNLAILARDKNLV